MLCCLHQDPAQPLGTLLGESAMVEDLPRLEGGRAEPGKGDEVLFVREPVHVPNLGQDEHHRVFPQPSDGEDEPHPGVLLRKGLDRLRDLLDLLPQAL